MIAVLGPFQLPHPARGTTYLSRDADAIRKISTPAPMQGAT